MRLSREQAPRPIFIDPLEPGDSGEWFIHRGLKEGVQRRIVNALGSLSQPTVVYRLIPETGFDAFEETKRHSEAGNPTFIRMNHEAIHDWVNDAAAVKRSQHLSSHAGGFRVPAGLGYYNKRPIGWFFSMVGVYPANRKIDQIKHLLKTGVFSTFEQAEEHVKTSKVNAERTTFNSKLLAGALEKVAGAKPTTAQAKPAHASYPQGTRKPHGEVDELHDDWSKVLEQMENPENAKIIILSKSYEGGRFMRRFLTPTIVVDIIDVPHGLVDKDQANAQLRERMKQGIAEADSGRVSREAVLSPLAKASLGLLAVSGAAGAAALRLRRS